MLESSKEIQQQMMLAIGCLLEDHRDIPHDEIEDILKLIIPLFQNVTKKDDISWLTRWIAETKAECRQEEAATIAREKLLLLKTPAGYRGACLSEL